MFVEPLIVCQKAHPEWLVKAALDALSIGRLFDAQCLASQAIQISQGSALGYTHALRASIFNQRGLLENAIQDFQQALIHLPFEPNFLRELCKIAQTGNSLARRVLTNSVNDWLSSRPQDWQLPVILESFKWITLPAFGVVEVTSEGNLKGWVVSTNNIVLIEVDGQRVEYKCDLASPELFNFGIGNSTNAFHIKLEKPFANCRLGISGYGSLWGSPIRGTLPFVHRMDLPNGTLETVDILIPVFKGFDDTLRCLNSLYNTQKSNTTAMRIVVINDVSPDTKLTQLLRSQAEKGLIHLIERPFNTGFVGAINTGLGVVSSNDVVLLNADTCVSGNWLDRLRNVAHSSVTIGTVTPISNHGELLSYPLPMQASDMPNDEQAVLLDTLFAQLGSVMPQRIPTGVGFCLYIRRAVLDELGGLNEYLIHRGYGEETEFCLRAAAMGWQNVAATNVFVAHQGSVSFGQEKLALVRRNIAQIHARFPHHGAAYDDYLQSNPLSELYRKVQRAWLAMELPKWKLPLHVVTEEIVAREVIKPTTPTLRLLILESRTQITLRLIVYGIAGLRHIDYEWMTQSDALMDDLNVADVSHVVLQDFARCPETLMQRLTARFSYQIQLKDYAGYCPRRYLLVEGEKLCDETLISEQTCTACVNTFGALVRDYKDMTSWKNNHQQWLAKAENVFAPTKIMAAGYLQQFPELSITVPTEKTALPLSSTAFQRFVIPSLESRAEGFWALIERLEQSSFASLLFILGNTFDDSRLARYPQVVITGSMTIEQQTKMMANYQCEALLDCSIWSGNPLAWQALAQFTGLPLLTLSTLEF